MLLTQVLQTRYSVHTGNIKSPADPPNSKQF